MYQKMMQGVMVVVCMSIILCQQNGKAESSNNGNVDPLCSNVTGIINITPAYPTCFDIFAVIPFVVGNSSTQCLALELGLICLAGIIGDQDDIGTCVYAMMQTALNNPENVTDAINDLGVSITTETFDVTYCTELDLTVDLVCLNISAAIEEVDVEECGPFFDTVLLETANLTTKCWALEDGIECLASFILSPMHVDGCVSTAMVTAANYPDILPEILQAVGKVASSVSLNVTNCPGFAHDICYNLTMVISQTTTHTSCKSYFESLETLEGEAGQCSALEAGFRCLSASLLEPIGVEACVNVLMEMAVKSQATLYHALQGIGIATNGLDFNTANCMKPRQTTSGTVGSSAARMFLNTGCFNLMLWTMLQSYSIFQ